MPGRRCWGRPTGRSGSSSGSPAASDGRAATQVEHRLATLVGQRVYGLAFGYEDLIDHDQLRHDPVLAVLAGKLAARRKD